MRVLTTSSGKVRTAAEMPEQTAAKARAENRDAAVVPPLALGTDVAVGLRPSLACARLYVLRVINRNHGDQK